MAVSSHLWGAVVQIKPHCSLSELKRIERAEKDADRVRRLRIVILDIEGWTAPAIAMAVGLSRRIGQRWAARENDLGLLSPRMNTVLGLDAATINRFLASIPGGEQAVMVWDGAGFHTSKSLRMPENITPVRLPPYSPELNPIENLWHYLKSHFWSNRSYQGAEDLEKAALTAWQAAVLDESLMKTVCSAPYAKRDTSGPCLKTGLVQVVWVMRDYAESKEGLAMRHALTDEQWAVIADLFPEPAATGRPPMPPRQAMDAIIWLNNTWSEQLAAKWRDLPASMGKWRTVYGWFDSWNSSGVLQKAVDRLTRMMVDGGGLSEELWCIDGTVIRAHRCAAGGGKKGIRKNRKTMRWDDPAEVSPRKSIFLRTGTAIPSVSN